MKLQVFQHRKRKRKRAQGKHRNLLWKKCSTTRLCARPGEQLQASSPGACSAPSGLVGEAAEGEVYFRSHQQESLTNCSNKSFLIYQHKFFFRPGGTRSPS